MSKIVQFKKNSENIFPNDYETKWTNVPLINNWTEYSSDNYRKCQYKKVNNIVYLEGLISNTQSTINTNFAILPEGFRPMNTVQFPVVSLLSEQTNGNKVLLLRIESNGKMTIQGQTLSSGIWISLSGVYFFYKIKGGPYDKA